MKYYVLVIQQWTQAGAEAPSESSKVTPKNTYDEALALFYDNLKTVSQTAAYNFMDAKIIQSDGGIIKKDQYGKYIEAAPVTPAEE